MDAILTVRNQKFQGNPIKARLKSEHPLVALVGKAPAGGMLPGRSPGRDGMAPASASSAPFMPVSHGSSCSRWLPLLGTGAPASHRRVLTRATFPCFSAL